MLGDFAELGADSQQIHQRIGEDIVNSKVERIYAVGDKMKHTVDVFNELVQPNGRQAQHFSSKQLMADSLSQQLRADVVVLVKGSRSQGLESIVEKITIKESGACC